MKCPDCDFENPENVRFCGNCATPLKPIAEVVKTGTETFPTYIYKLVPGKVFAGRYQIIEELGAGGMGRVYKAQDLNINEKIVIKLIHPEIAIKAKSVERFRNELRLTRKISHRNVCRMYDIQEDEGALYITMEYVAGEDLKRSIRMMGPLTIGKSISIAKQICEGLSEAHKLGISHRDLKPKNVVIDRGGNARIMDFGIASSLETKGLTDDGVAVGTPTYMAPEQAEGKDVDHRADIYSLGVILYEMVTGDVPFKGDTALSIALLHKTEQPRPPIELNSSVPEEFNQLILKCLEKNREKRFQSVDEILSRLSEIEEGISTIERVVVERPVRSTTFITNVKTFKVPGLLVVGLIAVFAIIFFLDRNWRQGSSVDSGDIHSTWKSSIAILPFEYLGVNEEDKLICTMITKHIVRELNNSFDELRVVPEKTTERFASENKSISMIGKELEVKTVLTGDVRINGENIDLGIALNDSDTEGIIWSNMYNWNKDNYFTEMGGMLQTLGQKLQVTLDIGRFQVGRIPHPKAYFTYYKTGIDFEQKYRETYDDADFYKSLQNYNEAIKLDPDYAEYYYGRGSLYEARFVEFNNKNDLQEMLNDFEEAYRLDPSLAEANLALGWTYYYKQDNEKAFEFFRKSVDLDTTNSEVNFNVGSFLRSLGLYSVATIYYSRALTFDPIHIQAYRIFSMCNSYLGKYELAVESLNKVLEMNPQNASHQLLLARQYIFMRDFSRASEIIDLAERIDSEGQFIPHIRITRAHLFAAQGEKDKVLDLLEFDYHYKFIYLFPNIDCLLGDYEKALDRIEYGIEQGFEDVKDYTFPYEYIQNNPYFRVLYDNSRFQKILGEQKQKHEKHMKTYRDFFPEE